MRNLVIKQRPTIEVDVTVNEPGESEPKTVKAVWRAYKYEVYQEKLEKVQSGELTDDDIIDADLVSVSDLPVEEVWIDEEVPSEVEDSRGFKVLKERTVTQADIDGTADLPDDLRRFEDRHLGKRLVITERIMSRQEAIDTCASITWVRGPLLMSWHMAMQGRTGAAEKNSSTRGDGGRRRPRK